MRVYSIKHNPPLIVSPSVECSTIRCFVAPFCEYSLEKQSSEYPNRRVGFSATTPKPTTNKKKFNTHQLVVNINMK